MDNIVLPYLPLPWMRGYHWDVVPIDSVVTVIPVVN
jgi:hypothetical protein